MTIDLKSLFIGIGLVIVIVPLVQGIVGFVLDLIELLSSYLRNKQALHASKIQAEIDSLSSSEEGTNAIGFQIPNNQEEYYEGDENE